MWEVVVGGQMERNWIIGSSGICYGGVSPLHCHNKLLGGKVNGFGRMRIVKECVVDWQWGWSGDGLVRELARGNRMWGVCAVHQWGSTRVLERKMLGWWCWWALQTGGGQCRLRKSSHFTYYIEPIPARLANLLWRETLNSGMTSRNGAVLEIQNGGSVIVIA